MSKSVYICPMLSKEQIQQEIKEMDGYLPISEIEKRLGMPPTTLQKVLKGTRKLPKKYEKVLEAYFVRKTETKVQDLTKPNVEAKPKEQPKTNYVANTNKPFMSDAIRKKLGL